MAEIQSAVALTDPPTHESHSMSPFPPPSPPPLYPPGDWWPFAPSPSPRRRKTRVAVVAVIAVVALAGGATVFQTGRDDASTPAATATAPATPSPDEPLPTVAPVSPTNSTTLDTNSIFALVDPAVVDITTKVDGGAAAGTGMVLTSSGLVITNNHVIDGATTISVQIAGSGPAYTAHVLGYDIADDIALLEIDDISGLSTITVGDSTRLTVGDPVVTIGNALGSDGPHAVSSGTIDALDQTITANDLTGDSKSLDGLIQTDASLQPGDSGGPLVDSAGRVIGMNTAASIGSRRVTSSTGSYAIPIDTALAIAQQIENGESSSTVHIGDRAILGIEATSARSLGQPGARVSAVKAGGPAAKAGIERDAVITAIDGTSISSVDDLGVALFPHGPGDAVEVTWTDVAGTSHVERLELMAGPPA